ncbi:MAG: hypothetical protein NTX45_29435 [Proteobacteria bacterium]|nr:hypothetical protein [Pseudomonadota bacterium]
MADTESLQNWTIENRSASDGLQLVAGQSGQAVQLNWDVASSGDYVQAKYTFPQPVDLSGADLFGVSLHGDGGGTATNMAIMFADVSNVFYGYDIKKGSSGINQINRWINLPLPKKIFHYFWGGVVIDWSRINQVFVVIKQPTGTGAGQLRIDQLQYDTAANWPRQTSFDTTHAASVPPQVTQNAVNYLLSSQAAETGLFISWQQEPFQKSWLYDQALVLLVLTREGIWQQGNPINDAARAAQRLITFISKVQKSDGHWARGWNPHTGEELSDNGWVGDQAWWVMALSSYAARSGDIAANTSAQKGSAWLAAQIDASGKVVPSTEGNVDVWWAMIATKRFADADRIQGYLLNTVWDTNLHYWWQGFNDPNIAMDAATWLSAFSRHSRVNQPQMGLAALSFVRRTLVTGSDDDTLCGLDGTGPVSIWNEGTAQYVAAGGADGKAFLDNLILQQKPDGSMPGSPDNWATPLGWLTPWSGLAPTSWLYFAVKGSPFINTLDVVKTGSGTGRVISDVDGIDCGATCGANFTSWTPVKLTAIPISGYQFSGWGGDCWGRGNSCTLTMDAAKTVTANFEVFKRHRPIWKRALLMQ